MKTLATFLIFALTITTKAADFSIDPIYTSHMVLQCEVPFAISGKGEAGHEINVILAEKTQTAKVMENGTWSANFPAMRPGGPFKLKAIDNQKITTLEDIFLGDVWLCSGKSNTQMGLDEAIAGTAIEAWTPEGELPELAENLLRNPKRELM